MGSEVGAGNRARRGVVRGRETSGESGGGPLSFLSVRFALRSLGSVSWPLRVTSPSPHSLARTEPFGRGEERG